MGAVQTRLVQQVRKKQAIETVGNKSLLSPVGSKSERSEISESALSGEGGRMKANLRRWCSEESEESLEDRQTASEVFLDFLENRRDTEVINLEGLHLKSLPKLIFRGVPEIKLANNRLHTLPPVGRFFGNTLIDLRNNPLQGIPDEYKTTNKNITLHISEKDLPAEDIEFIRSRTLNPDSRGPRFVLFNDANKIVHEDVPVRTSAFVERQQHAQAPPVPMSEQEIAANKVVFEEWKKKHSKDALRLTGSVLFERFINGDPERKPKLNLSEMNLDNLPDISYKGLSSLNVSFNLLTTLPDVDCLPENLVIDARKNPIWRIPQDYKTANKRITLRLSVDWLKQEDIDFLKAYAWNDSSSKTIFELYDGQNNLLNGTL